MKGVMCAVAVLVAVPVFADEKKEVAVRKLALTDEDFQRSRDDVPKAIEIKSADELAKATVFRDDDGRDAAKKQVDFAKEKLVVFVWKGSAADTLEYFGPDTKGNLMFIYKTRGEAERGPRARVYVVSKDVPVVLLQSRKGDR